MMDLNVLLLPADRPAVSQRLESVLYKALDGISCQVFRDPDCLLQGGFRGRPVLFALPVGRYGIYPASNRLLFLLRSHYGLLEGCTAGILVDGGSDLYTKSVGTDLAFAANKAGAALIGRPLVEGTGSLANFRVLSKLNGVGLRETYELAARELVQRLISEQFTKPEKPRMLALHASSHRTSNTMQLWERVSEGLKDSFEISELGLRNGTISDCSGCPYTMCVHFGEKGRCFYGGLMQEEVWPAVLRADSLMMICPNYNDALSANLTAFINRLTGLFRQQRFYDKALFAIIVSGYSGGDIIARQLISAMNMNKSFYLPPRFALMETANDPGEALKLPGIDERICDFMVDIRKTMLEDPYGDQS